MKLLCELHGDVGSFTSINKKTGEKNYFFEGVYIQTEIANKNKRIYPKGLMINEVEDYQRKIKNRTAVGELDHPANNPTVEFKNASHLIESLTLDGNNFVGRSKVLSTPMGCIVKNLMDDGVNFGVSTRGVGAVKKNYKGLNEVTQYKLCTAADIVTDPSAPEAMQRAIMEGADWVYDLVENNWSMIPVVEGIQREFHKTRASRITEEQKLKAWNDFLNSFKG